MTSLTELPIWKALQQHYTQIAPLPMRQLFDADSQRFENFSLSAATLLLDYSKNRINQETMALLCQLADVAQLTAKIADLFNGTPINSTERQAALHTALRAQQPQSDIQTNLEKMQQIVAAILQHKWRGYSGEAITQIINIGIGGSELGPAMAIEALKPYSTGQLNFYFISNIDGFQIETVLKNLQPEKTLFIVSSKSFVTQETLHNAEIAKQWLLQASKNLSTMQQHFIAITAKPDRAIKFGIRPENVLTLWEWVGGRFSLWSAIGLPIALSIGFENFQQLLAGAHAMDNHFRTAPFNKNMPVILALLSLWYGNFFQTQSHAILPYDQRLQLLPTYLQQAHMESYGKQMRHNGAKVDYSTGGVIWGGVGTNGQHTFLQLLHQGTQIIPADFIVALQHHHSFNDSHHALFANCLSQAQALMIGKSYEEILAELIALGSAESEAQLLARHKMMPGNRPSNLLLLDKLSPFSLGALIALYEHKIFTLSVLWDINCFDQWGVELGKKLADQILQDLQSEEISAQHDHSTRRLIEHYKNLQNKSFYVKPQNE